MKKLEERFNNIINDLMSKNINVVKRLIKVHNGVAAVLYISELTDKVSISEYVIKPIVDNSKDTELSPDNIGDFIYARDFGIEIEDSLIEKTILEGLSVILFSASNKYVAVDIKHVEKRGIPTPETMYTIRGPKDCFIEDLDTNLSLIRYRIKDPNLRIDQLEAGRRTKTRINVIYIEDVANETSVTEVKKRIENIDIDGIIESGELQAFMLNRKLNLFPQMGLIERSDMACGALLEGKVVVVVDGSEWVLVAPKTFGEFLWSCEDFYDNKYIGLLLRILRIISLFISFAATSIYIAIVSFHNDVLPSSYMIAIATSRAKVPFNAFVEVLLIELIAELIHESLIRVPKKVGAAVGIVGAIIIGQAAVTAGVFSPLLLIVIAITLISTFIPADYTLVNAFRILKFLLILATGTFGLFGFTLVMTLILANLVSINTFGVPYLAPYTPFSRKGALRSLFYSLSIHTTRPDFLKPKNKNRGQGNKNQKL